MKDELEAELKAAGALGDDELDIAGVALTLALLDHPYKDRSKYLGELAALTDATREALDKADAKQAADADLVAMVLANIIAGRFSYRGDNEAYDDLRNADLTEVIDRRKGLPVALGIIYLHVARTLGLDLRGLNFPGHFVLRLQVGPQATIIDPFNRGQTLNPADLLNLLRSVEGPGARLTPDHHTSVSARDILLRLQNNILSRSLGQGGHERAREVVTRMIAFAPERAGLRFELGRIEIYASHMTAAAAAFTLARDMAEAQGEQGLASMASEALRRLRAKLN
ncbi:MAG: transglutaminase-like domain-containing protein [Pseudomonadota bacterium]